MIENVVLLASEQGVLVNAKSKQGDTPLHLAAQQVPASEAMIKTLLDAGADPDALNNQQQTPLLLGLEQPDIWSMLLEDGGADPDVRVHGGGSVLHAAASAGLAEAAQQLIDKGADVDMMDQGGDTALMRALQSPSCSVALVKALRDAGTDPNVVSESGKVALVYALDNSAALEILLDGPSPADPNISLPDGDTVLHHAARVSNCACLKLLMAAGADSYAKDAKGFAPSMYVESDEASDILEGRVEEMVEDMLTKRRATGSAPSASMSAAKTVRTEQRQPQKRKKRERVNQMYLNTMAQKHRGMDDLDNMPKRPVFVSFRVKEARSEAMALKRELEQRGVGCFCSETDIPKGADWVKTIFRALEYSKLMVVLMSATYGSPGSDVFATYEELTFAKKERMAIFVIKMVDRVKEAGVQAMLNPLQGSKWHGRGETEGDANGCQLSVPEGLLKDLLDMVSSSVLEDGDKHT
uniref:TIR domain-containing protein n=1 Tax=Chlamydomonas euryale TaxID=1486919 RepID=A0A7R9VEH2_9CHLO